MDSTRGHIFQAEAILNKANTQLQELLVKLATSIKIFPGFLDMDTVQAIELEPIVGFPDRGCIVVTPEGFLKEMVLSILPGAATLGGYEQSEQLTDLDLPSHEETIYLYCAIDVLVEWIEAN